MKPVDFSAIEALRERCIVFLTTIAKPALDEEDDVHWIDARHADSDQCPSYCREHGKAMVDHLNAEKCGQFPRRIQMSPGRVGWDADEVTAWINALKSARQDAAS
jgi:hypothetical protein